MDTSSGSHSSSGALTTYSTASMPLPMRPALRAASSARETSPRTSSSRSHSAARRSLAHSPRSSGKVVTWMLSGLPAPGICAHTSSVVKLRMGASSRVSAVSTSKQTVCAARRRGSLGAEA